MHNPLARSRLSQIYAGQFLSELLFNQSDQSLHLFDKFDEMSNELSTKSNLILLLQSKSRREILQESRIMYSYLRNLDEFSSRRVLRLAYCLKDYELNVDSMKHKVGPIKSLKTWAKDWATEAITTVFDELPDYFRFSSRFKRAFNVSVPYLCYDAGRILTPHELDMRAFPLSVRKSTHNYLDVLQQNDLYIVVAREKIIAGSHVYRRPELTENTSSSNEMRGRAYSEHVKMSRSKLDSVIADDGAAVLLTQNAAPISYFVARFTSEHTPDYAGLRFV